MNAGKELSRCQCQQQQMIFFADEENFISLFSSVLNEWKIVSCRFKNGDSSKQTFINGELCNMLVILVIVLVGFTNVYFGFKPGPKHLKFMIAMLQ